MRNVFFAFILISLLYSCTADKNDDCPTGSLEFFYDDFTLTNGQPLGSHNLLDLKVNGINTFFVPTNLRDIRPDLADTIMFDNYPISCCYEETGEYVEFEYNPAPPHDDIKTCAKVRIISIERNF